MAFKKNPREDTYSQHSIALTFNNQLDGSGITNMLPMPYFLPDGETYNILKTRPPVIGAVVDNSNTSGMVCRGLYVWEKDDTNIYYFVVVDNKVYTSTDGSTWTLRHTLDTTASAYAPVGFTEFIDSSTNTKSLVLVDGVQGFSFTSDLAGDEITDAQFPTPHLPFPVYLDGYLFLAKPDTGDIYNSDLNNEMSWTAGSFISSELYPDDVKAIAKVNNYLLAIGRNGSEFFYDAANATASPLRRIDGNSLPFGTSFPYAMASNKDSIVLIANRNDGEASVQLISGTETKEITPPFLAKDLTTYVQGEGANSHFKVWGSFARINGDWLYLLTIGVNTSSALDANVRCYGYSFNHNIWFKLATGDGTREFTVTRTAFSGRGAASGSGSPLTYVGGYSATANRPFFGQWADGQYQITNTGKDAITNVGTEQIVFTVVSPLMTFGTLNRKFVSRLGVLGYTDTNGTASTLTVSYKESDASAYKTSRTLTLLGTEPLSNPFISQLGAYRKLRIKLSGSNDKCMFLHSMFIDINKGVR